jgi:hypothetical protein
MDNKNTTPLLSVNPPNDIKIERHDIPNVVTSPDISNSKQMPVLTDIRDSVMTTIVEPTFQSDLSNAVYWRQKWSTISSVIYAIAEICTLATVILIFISGYYNNTTLALISGSIGILASVLQRFGAYATNQSIQRTKDANTLLTSIGIVNSFPILDDNNNFINNNKPTTQPVQPSS